MLQGASPMRHRTCLGPPPRVSLHPVFQSLTFAILAAMLRTVVRATLRLSGLALILRLIRPLSAPPGR